MNLKACQRQGAGQGAKLIVDDQNRPCWCGRISQLLQQIQIGCIKRLQGRVSGFGVTIELEGTKGGVARLHGITAEGRMDSQYT